MGNGPIGPGPRQNGTIITPGTTVYNPPLTVFYFPSASTFVAVTNQNAETLNFGTVAAGTTLNDWAIQQVLTASVPPIAGW